MTWKDVKLATLQKMYASTGSEIIEDESTNEYLAAMPFVCNEALQQLSTAGKFIIKKIQIANNPIENLLGDDISKEITQILEMVEITSTGGKSYSFSYLGAGVLTISTEDFTATVTLPKTTYFEAYRGIITNPDGKEVKFSFVPSYPSAVKDFGVYEVSYLLAADVPPFTEKIKYDISTLVADFYQLAENSVFFEGGSNEQRYIQSTEYFQEGNNIFVIDRNIPGNYTIYYKAYPGEITSLTADTYIFPLDPEVAVLIPSFMASMLYKDDDASTAATYRNEFEVGFSRLSQRKKTPTAERFVNKNGWL